MNQSTMHTHLSHVMPAQNYPPGNYNYSSSGMYNPSFPYNNQCMQPITHSVSIASPSNHDGFSVPSHHIDRTQYNNGAPCALLSGSSAAESNGSIVSETDTNQNQFKKRRKPAPTIATGRRNLKNESVNTEEAERRDKRRERNRKSAQRCRERKMEKKDVLEKQILDTDITCNRYLELAENVLRSWKQRLYVLNEKLPCNNYKSQLPVSDFENVIEMMRNRNKELSEVGDSGGSMVDTNMSSLLKQEYNTTRPDNTTFINCPKLEPYFTAFNCDVNGVLNTEFEQYHTCLSESSLSYM